MDTRLKKSHKLTTFIITLCILLPAFLLVALYPQVSQVMHDREKEYEVLQEEAVKDGDYFEEWDVKSQFLNYAMETSYYLYGMIQKEDLGVDVDFRVLNEYGWTGDFLEIHDSIRYHAEYDDGETIVERKNADILEEDKTVGFITLVFDSQGYLSEVEISGEIYVQSDYEGNDPRSKARKSIDQYKNNVSVFESNHNVEIDETQVMPKNFTIQFAIDEDSDFIMGSSIEHIYVYDYYMSPENLLLETGVIWIMGICAVFVALMALILPFFKKLQTGKEKLFCIPFEIVAALAVGVVFGAIGMYYVMAMSCSVENHLEISILGYEVGAMTQYIILLILNFLGWATVFFAEYVVIAALRQFLCGPVYYLKKRVLFVRVFRWIKKLCIRLYRYITDINISSKLNSSILKIVLANFVILTMLCVMWVFGIVGIIIYSIVLYVILRHYGEKIQRQFNSVLGATKQMAEGNLKIALEEDLGVFQPIGDSLQDVQKGFEKAVVEEAKSQNMKTELITNVSHDLKTPLTAIITYVDLLKQDNISEEERKSYVQTLDQKSQRLKVLIEDLFEVSKAHSGNVKMNFMDVDIVSLMKQVRLELSDQIEASDLVFRWNLPDEKVVLSLDGERTYRVFENLLGNALKYAMPHSRVYVDVLDNESTVQVVFRNISAQELDFDPERLTERFVRGDASRNSEGSGLGLAIAKSFVELQHGKLNIEVDGDLFKATISWDK